MELAGLAALSRDAALEIPAEARRAAESLDSGLRKSLTVADYLDIAKTMKKQRMTTAEMILAVAERIAADRPYGPIAKRFRPDLPKDKAEHYLRACVSKNRKTIDDKVRELKHK